MNRGDISGFQVGGLGNSTRGDVAGFQVGGYLNNKFHITLSYVTFP